MSASGSKRNISSAARSIVSAGLFAALLAASAAQAHHSFAGINEHEPITVHGVVTRIHFKNPHTTIFLEAKDSSGKDVMWRFEAGKVADLYSNGFKWGVIKSGDEVTIKGFGARDSSRHQGAAHEVIMADGRSFVVGPATIPPKR